MLLLRKTVVLKVWGAPARGGARVLQGGGGGGGGTGHPQKNKINKTVNSQPT